MMPYAGRIFVTGLETLRATMDASATRNRHIEYHLEKPDGYGVFLLQGAEILP